MKFYENTKDIKRVLGEDFTGYYIESCRAIQEELWELETITDEQGNDITKYSSIYFEKVQDIREELKEKGFNLTRSDINVLNEIAKRIFLNY